MYLGFSSTDLDQNQITDYLTRVVQPKLSAISGVQRADILGDRTFAMRIWLKPDQMAALGISPSAVRDALARNNYLSALGQHQGLDGVGEPRRQHRPADARGVPSAGRQGAGRRRRPARRHRRRRARRRELRRRTSASTARRRRSWASGCCRPRTRSTSSSRCARRCPEIQAQLPAGHEGRHPVRLDRLHPGRDRRGAARRSPRRCSSSSSSSSCSSARSAR